MPKISSSSSSEPPSDDPKGHEFARRSTMRQTNTTSSSSSPLPQDGDTGTGKSLSRSTRGNLKRRKTKKQHGRLKQLAGTLRKELKDDPLFYRRIATAAGDSDTVPLSTKELTDYFLYQKSQDPVWYAKYKDRLYLLQDYQKALVDRERDATSSDTGKGGKGGSDNYSLAYTTLNEMDDFWLAKKQKDDRKLYRYKKLQYRKEQKEKQQQQILEKQQQEQQQQQQQQIEREGTIPEGHGALGSSSNNDASVMENEQLDRDGHRDGQLPSRGSNDVGNNNNNTSLGHAATRYSASRTVNETTNSVAVQEERGSHGGATTSSLPRTSAAATTTTTTTTTTMSGDTNGNASLLGPSAIHAVAGVGAGIAAAAVGIATRTHHHNDSTTTSEDQNPPNSTDHTNDDHNIMRSHYAYHNEDDVPEDELMFLNQSIHTTPSRDYYGEENRDRCGTNSSMGDTYSFSSDTAGVLSPLPPHFMDSSQDMNDGGNAYTFFWDMRMSLEDAFQQAVHHPLPHSPESSVVGNDDVDHALLKEMDTTTLEQVNVVEGTEGEENGIELHLPHDYNNNNDAEEQDAEEQEGEDQHRQQQQQQQRQFQQPDFEDRGEESGIELLLPEESDQPHFQQPHFDDHDEYDDEKLFSLQEGEQQNFQQPHFEEHDENHDDNRQNNHVDDENNGKITLSSMTSKTAGTTPDTLDQEKDILMQKIDDIVSSEMEQQNETIMSIMVTEEEEQEQKQQRQQAMQLSTTSFGDENTVDIDGNNKSYPQSHDFMGSDDIESIDLQPRIMPTSTAALGSATTFIPPLQPPLEQQQLDEEQQQQQEDDFATIVLEDGTNNGDGGQQSMKDNNFNSSSTRIHHNHDNGMDEAGLVTPIIGGRNIRNFGGTVGAGALLTDNNACDDDAVGGIVIAGDVHVGDVLDIDDDDDDDDGDDVPSYVGLNSENSVTESLTFVDGGSTMADTLSEVDSNMRDQHEDGGFPRYTTDELMARMAELEDLRRRSVTAGTSTDELMARMAELEALRRRAASMNLNKDQGALIDDGNMEDNGNGSRDDEVDELSDWLDAELDAPSTSSPIQKAGTPVQSAKTKQSIAGKKSATRIMTTNAATRSTTKDESRRKMEKSLQRGQSKWNNLARNKNSSSAISKRPTPTNRSSRIPTFKSGQSPADSTTFIPNHRSMTEIYHPKSPTGYDDRKIDDRPEWRMPSKEEMAYIYSTGFGSRDDGLGGGSHSFSPSSRWKMPDKMDSSSYYDHILDSELASPAHKGERSGVLSPASSVGPRWRPNSSTSRDGGRGGGEASHFTFNGDGDEAGYGGGGYWSNQSRSNGGPRWRNPSKQDAGYSSSYLGPSAGGGESSGPHHRPHDDDHRVLSPGRTPRSPNSPIEDRPRWRMPTKAELQTMSLDPFNTSEEDTEICSLKWIPNIHDNVGGCEYCLLNATEEGKRAYEATGRHYAINRVRGGCSRNCFKFPRREDEPPVRLCRNCFYITHKIPDEYSQEFFRGYSSPLARVGVASRK